MSDDGSVVLLFHPQTFHQRNYREYHVPYSLLAIAAGVDRTRWDLRIFDNNVEARSDFSDCLRGVEDRLACVAITSMIGRQIHDALRFAEGVRRMYPSVPLVWGGPLPTVLPELTADHPLVDLVFAGQGQRTFPDFLDELGQDEVPLRRNIGEACARVINASSWGRLTALGSFRGVYDLVGLEGYVHDDEHINTRTISYHSSQGCPFSCGFCSETALWGGCWVGTPIAQVSEDVRYLVETLGVNGIKFYDAEFFANARRVLSLATQMKSIDADIRWGAAAHPRSLARLTDADMTLLKASGLRRILIGAESGVASELELVGKETSRDTLLSLAQRCAEFGITASFSFVTGYPGAPSRNTQVTLDFGEELAAVSPEHEVKVHFFAPYPGTPLYATSLDHGFVPPATLEEWADYDYYNITTPWVESSWAPKVREFNEAHCPYVSSATSFERNSLSSERS